MCAPPSPPLPTCPRSRNITARQSVRCKASPCSQVCCSRQQQGLVAAFDSSSRQTEFLESRVLATNIDSPALTVSFPIPGKGEG